MAKRGQPCDCCGAPRLRWQRLCNACFHALPPGQRNAVLDTWGRGDKRAWREARTVARAAIAAQPKPDPVAAYQRVQKLLGERE